MLQTTVYNTHSSSLLMSTLTCTSTADLTLTLTTVRCEDDLRLWGKRRGGMYDNTRSCESQSDTGTAVGMGIAVGMLDEMGIAVCMGTDGGMGTAEIEAEAVTGVVAAFLAEDGAVAGAEAGAEAAAALIVDGGARGVAHISHTFN